MTVDDQIPLSAAILVSFLMLLGAALTLIGAIGTLRLRSFFERMHGPSLGVSWSLGAMLLASMLYFSVLESRLVLHEIVIGVFMMITAPVVLIMLGRASLYRERQENNEAVPTINKVIGDITAQDAADENRES